MSLFSKIKDFQKNRDDKKVSSALAKIKNPKAIRDDRVAAIQAVSDLKDAEVAVPILLQRFEYSLEHGINDTREKESCAAGIVAFGSSGVPAIRSHLKESHRIAWPIKVLKQLGDEDNLVDILMDCLDFNDIAFDQAKVDKNYDILCYLRDYKLQNKAEKLAHFLKDPDERVRFAVTEVLVEQDDPEIPGLIEHFLADSSPDNTRIRQTTVQAFAEKGWKLKKPDIFPNRQISENVVIKNDNTIEIRQ